MIQRLISVACVVAMIALFDARSTQAEIVTYRFSGVISQNLGLFALPAGNRFNGYFAYDASAPITSSTSPNVAVYMTALQHLVVDGTSRNPFAVRIDNRDAGSQDSLTLFGGSNFNEVRLTLSDSSGEAFSSLALPQSLDLNDFTHRSIIRLPGVAGPVNNVGTIDTLTRLSQPPALNPVSVFTNQATFFQQAPIVHTSTFENLPFGGLGNPLSFEGVTYTTQLTNGAISGEFIRTEGSEGFFGLGNNSHSRMTISFGEDNSVFAFGLALKPQYAATGEWKIVLSLIDGGTKVESVPYGADLVSRYRGFNSTVGIRSIEIVTVGTSNMSIDSVSFARIVPEPSTTALALSGVLLIVGRALCRIRLGRWKLPSRSSYRV